MRSRLPVTVWLVLGILLITNTQLSLITPLIPHFKQEFGLSNGAIGMFVAFHPTATILASLPAGMVAARWGSRSVVVISALLAASASLCIGYAAHPVVLFAGRFLQGSAGAFVWAGGLAWLVSAAPPAQQGRAVGLGVSANSAGSVIGPAVGALAAVLSLPVVFSTLACLFLTLGVLLARRPSTARAREPAPRPSELLGALRNGDVRTAGLLMVVGGVAFGGILAMIPLTLHDRGASEGFLGGTFVLASVAITLVARYAGSASDRYGHIPLIQLGLVLSAALAGFLTVPNSTWAIAAVVVLLMSGAHVFLVPAVGLFASHATRSGISQAVAFGLINMMWAIGNASGALLGGWSDAVGRATPSLLAAALMVLMVGVVQLHRRRTA